MHLLQFSINWNPFRLVVLKMDLIQWSAFIMLTSIIEISLTVKCCSSNLNLPKFSECSLNRKWIVETFRSQPRCRKKGDWKFFSKTVCCELCQISNKSSTSGFPVRRDPTRNAKSSVISPPVTPQKEDTACVNSWCLIWLHTWPSQHACANGELAFLLTKELIICRLVVSEKKCLFTIQRNGGKIERGNNVTVKRTTSVLLGRFRRWDRVLF